jgi:hypothetical protein
MDTVTRMLESHPRASTAAAGAAAIGEALQALLVCSQACTSCADACLGEERVAELRRCIRLDLDCADVCQVTARLLSRYTETDWDVVRGQLESCVVACRACGAECEHHAEHMEHCRICADACQACERACQDLVVALRA